MVKTRKEKKEIRNQVAEQMSLIEDVFEPSISKSLEMIKQKFGLKNIHFEYKIDWKIKVDFNT